MKALRTFCAYCNERTDQTEGVCALTFFFFSLKYRVGSHPFIRSTHIKHPFYLCKDICMSDLPENMSLGQTHVYTEILLCIKQCVVPQNVETEPKHL